MNKYAVISVTMAVVGTNCNSFQTASFTNIRNFKSNERQTRTNVLSMNQLSPEFSTNGPFSEHVNMFNNPFAIADSSTLPSGEPLPAVEGLSPEANIIVFIIGIIPFIWATYEFWSRIAVGASFGTGADSIQIRPSSTTIGKDGEPLKSRGQQVLGDDALVVAYILFAIAISSVSIALYSVISSPMNL